MSRKPEDLKTLEVAARRIAELIDQAMPPHVGFFLSLFDHGEGGWSTYVSNSRRLDMVKFLRELADKLEAGAIQ